MSIGAHLIHQCEIQRGRATTDSYGAEKVRWPPEIPAHLADVPCRLIIKDQRVGDTAFAERPIVTTYTLLLSPQHQGQPIDIRQGDRAANIRDKDGTVEAGPFRIDSIRKRHARAARHLSLVLEKIG